MPNLYVAETFRPKNIWIAGMDFYAAEYWLGPLNDKQKKAAKDGLIERLVDEFLGVVERYPEVTFKIVTEYSKLPVDDYSNLKVIREKKK